MAFEGQEYAAGSGKQRVIFWKSVSRTLSLRDGEKTAAAAPALTSLGRAQSIAMQRSWMLQ